MTPELCVLKSNKSHSDDVIAMMKTAQTKSNREISKLEKEVAELKKELKATKDGKEDTVDMYAKRKEIDFEAHIAKKRAEIKLQEEKEAKKLSAKTQRMKDATGWMSGGGGSFNGRFRSLRGDYYPSSSVCLYFHFICH